MVAQLPKAFDVEQGNDHVHVGTRRGGRSRTKTRQMRIRMYCWAELGDIWAWVDPRSDDTMGVHSAMCTRSRGQQQLRVFGHEFSTS